MSFVKKLSWILFSNIFSSFVKWMIVVLIARNLSATEVGVYSLAFAVSAPITLLANMKLRSLYITSRENNLLDYLYLRNSSSIFAILTLVLVGSFFYSEYLLIILFVGLGKILDLQSDIYYSLPHKHTDLNVIGKMVIAKQLIVITAFSTTLFLSESLSLSLLFQLLFQLIYLLLVEKKYVEKHYSYTQKKPTVESVKKVLALGFPLGFVQMLYSLNTNYPRFVLEFFESPEILGYFSAIVYIILIVNLFMDALSQIVLPKLAKLYQANQIKIFSKYIYVYLTPISFGIGLFITISSLLFGESILTMLYGKEYALYSDILVLISISVGINLISWNFDTTLMAMRFIKVQPIIALIIAIINIISAYYLIKKFGITGAAYSMIFINLLQLILRIFAVNYKIFTTKRRVNQ